MIQWKVWHQVRSAFEECKLKTYQQFVFEEQQKLTIRSLPKAPLEDYVEFQGHSFPII